ncbi:Hypothetical predicted protein [Mytilus galloprovincialis]|uniref:Uncharacterized protein n=1 Tax=Mytilus galloprovincialis TaxID=29158 RepID=A0A8B6D5D8_MYTGA|nr:Hypothetical predicted protein [Mytilus galloprovincialis]
MFLQSYDYEIIYKKGTANGNADALSRRPYDTEIATITTATVESSTQTEASFIELDPYASICEITTSPKEKVVNDQRTDENFKDVIKYILDKELPDKTRQARKTVIESQDYIIDDDVLYHLYYPKGKGHRADRIVKRLAVPLTLRDDILKSYHDSLLGGHGGIERTYHTIRYKYYWPGMYSDIQQYVQTCIQCQRAKPDAHKRPTPLQPLPILDVFRRVHMDILGPFRKSPDGYSHVLLVVDSFSKYVEIFPMKNTGAKDVANIFYNQWICRYSAPDAILTDKGQNFMSNILKEVCNIFEIKKMRTSSYRPQTNSTCERNNKTIAEKLRTYIAANQLDWPDKLSSIAHAMNTSVCTESTQYTPYYMVFSRECRTPIDTVLTAPTNVGPDARLFIDGLHSNVLLAREIAKENSLEAQQKYKAQHDKNAREATFKIRDKVWMDTKTTPVGYSRKLCNKWQGPYYITEVTGKNTYKLRRCSDDVPIKGPVNANRLKQYHDPQDRPTNNVDVPTDDEMSDDEDEEENAQDADEIVQTDTQPENQVQRNTDDIRTNDDPDLYQVERIIHAKRINKKMHYKIKWLGYSHRHNTYEPEENIPQELRHDFKVRKDQAKRIKARKTKR